MTRLYPYRCRHCGTPWESAYLAQLCFEEDMKKLEKEEEKESKPNKDKFHLKQKQHE